MAVELPESNPATLALLGLAAQVIEVPELNRGRLGFPFEAMELLESSLDELGFLSFVAGVHEVSDSRVGFAARLILLSRGLRLSFRGSSEHVFTTGEGAGSASSHCGAEMVWGCPTVAGGDCDRCSCGAASTVGWPCEHAGVECRFRIKGVVTSSILSTIVLLRLVLIDVSL